MVKRNQFVIDYKIIHVIINFLFTLIMMIQIKIGDGALLPSPTREKLEPVVPRRRDDSKEIRDEIQPRPKSSPKNSPRTGRSQSLGPLSRSPKRQTPRTPSVNKDVKVKLILFYLLT